MPNSEQGRKEGAPLAAALFVIVIAQTIVSLDFSLVSIALPRIEAGLGITAATAQWILTTDIVVYGGFLVVGGRFADNFGQVRSMLIGLSLFLIGSIVNMAAGGIAALLLGRAIQGLGAAFTFPATVSLLAHNFPAGPARFRALTISTATQAAGVPLGTMVGGALVTHFGGQAAFLLNIPVCLILLLLIRIGLVRGSDVRTAQSIPVGSALVLALATGLLIQSALAVVSKDATTRSLAVYAFPASIAVFSAFVLRQRRSSNPLISLKLLKIENLAIYILVSAMMIMVGKGMVVLSNISLQQGLHFTPWQASLALIPMATSAVLLVPLTPFIAPLLLERPRSTMAGGFVLMGLMHFFLGHIPGTIAAGSLFVILFLQPYVSVTATNIGTGEILRRVPQQDQGVAAALLYTAVQIIGGLGMAMMIAATNRDPAITDDFTRFSPGFTIAASAAFCGMLLVWMCIRPTVPGSPPTRLAAHKP